MNTQKVFAKMVKTHSKEETAVFVSDYRNIKEVAKMLIAMPDSYLETFELRDDHENPISLTYDKDGGVWCQNAIYEGGRVARSEGTCYVDTNCLGEISPEEFVLEGEGNVKILHD